MFQLTMHAVHVAGIIGRALGKALVDTGKYYTIPAIIVEPCVLEKMSQFYVHTPSSGCEYVYNAVKTAIALRQLVFMIVIPNEKSTVPHAIFILATQNVDRRVEYTIYDTVNTWKEQQCKLVEELADCFKDALVGCEYQP